MVVRLGNVVKQQITVKCKTRFKSGLSSNIRNNVHVRVPKKTIMNLLNVFSERK